MLPPLLYDGEAYNAFAATPSLVKRKLRCSMFAPSEEGGVSTSESGGSYYPFRNSKLPTGVARKRIAQCLYKSLCSGSQTNHQDSGTPSVCRKKRFVNVFSLMICYDRPEIYCLPFIVTNSFTKAPRCNGPAVRR